MSLPLCITCQPGDLDQGLFGNVLAHPFQVLPYLYERGIFPAWDLRSQHYAEPPDFLTVPGGIDLAYAPPPGPHRMLSLNELRRRHGRVLGNDWKALATIWNAYFRVPQRVLSRLDGILPRGRVLGVHYRGTDKLTTGWDSNPITQSEYLFLVEEYVSQSESFDAIFVGTDDYTFVEALRSRFAAPVIELGAVEFHMAATHSMSRVDKTDRAMLDCLLFSRCHTVLQTSSALPSFAKIFNPELESYRCAASKLFTDMAYFPVAHIPVLPVTSAKAKEILSRTMQDDWTEQPEMARFRSRFVSAPRWPRNDAFFHLAEKAGAGDLAARLVTGYR